LLATSSLVIEGQVLAGGTMAGGGDDGTANVKTGNQTGEGGDGGSGGSGLVTGAGQGGDGGPPDGGGTIGGNGGDGGAGAGGGILLYCGGNSGIVISGSVKTLGGGGLPGNGGTVKIRFAGQKPEGDIQAGRVHYLAIEGGGCAAGCPGNQVCDEAAGLCLEPAVCVDDVDCLGNRICENGICQDPKLPPSITIVQPQPGFTTSADSLAVSGTATDDTGVAKVEFLVNGGAWTVCNGTTNWTCNQVGLTEGSNNIEVRAIDVDEMADTASVIVTKFTEPVCVPSTEVCDGQDNDCDDLVDEDGVCNAQPPLPADFSGVTWLHKNVSGWSQTANMASVTFNGGQICLNYDKANVWPGVQHVGHNVNANPWVFIWQDNKWYAATWEWMKVGQTCKNKSAVAGDHIKKNPLWDFQPVSGTTYYFMVSGLARDAVTNVSERSNVVEVVWP